MSEKNTPLPRRPKTSRAIRRSRSAPRRGFLTGIAALAPAPPRWARWVVAPAMTMTTTSRAAGSADTARHHQVAARQGQDLVVIYAENRSFNNLFANFPGVESRCPRSPPPYMQQPQRALRCAVLKANRCRKAWSRAICGTCSIRTRCRSTAARTTASSPGRIRAAWSWATSDSAYNLRLWKLAQEFTLCDNFFQGAFGGSFLNQIPGRRAAPVYPDAANSVAKVQIAQLQSADPTDTRLQPKPTSPASALTGSPQFGPSALSPDGFGVNTMGPPYWPAFSRSAADPTQADPANPMTMVPQGHANIGDLMTAKGLDWAWYAGGWQAAVDSTANTGFPASPNFQAHHQPFNYLSTAPGTPARTASARPRPAWATSPRPSTSRRAISTCMPATRTWSRATATSPTSSTACATARNGRTWCDITATNKFWPTSRPAAPLTFYKPQGNLNMHAGYGRRATATSPTSSTACATARNGRTWWWSSPWTRMAAGIAPPKGDRWGPGSRVPTLVISPFSKKGAVDHTIYDTGSILRLATRLFDLPVLDGLKARDEAMKGARAADGRSTNALTLGA